MKYSLIKKINSSPISIMEYHILDAVIGNRAEDYIKDEGFSENIQNLRNLELISDNNKLTVKGKDLWDVINAAETGDYFERLHKKLQDKLVELTGRKQVMMDGRYAFLPNATDLKNRFISMGKRYKISDWDWGKVEKILIQHIEKSKKGNFNKVRLIKYYILGQNGEDSDLYTAYEVFEDSEQAKQEEFNGVNI